MHDDVALAVCGTSAVPAAIALREGPGVGGPFLDIAGRLHIEVGVQEDRRVALGGFLEADDGFGAIGRDVRFDGDADGAELLEAPSSCTGVVLFESWGGVDGFEGDELLQGVPEEW